MFFLFLKNVYFYNIFNFILIMYMCAYVCVSMCVLCWVFCWVFWGVRGVGEVRIAKYIQIQLTDRRKTGSRS